MSVFLFKDYFPREIIYKSLHSFFEIRLFHFSIVSIVTDFSIITYIKFKSAVKFLYFIGIF